MTIQNEVFQLKGQREELKQEQLRLAFAAGPLVTGIRQKLPILGGLDEIPVEEILAAAKELRDLQHRHRAVREKIAAIDRELGSA